MHPMDRYFFDGPSGNRSYTVTRFLDDLRARYGGVDGLLVWNTYPHLGFDDRNAFDLIRLLPGGLAGIRGFVAELRAAGVSSLWPFNPWDDATRTPAYGTHADFPSALAALVRDTGADGFNGDTMADIPLAYYNAAASVGPGPGGVMPRGPPAMQAELGASLESLAWTTLGWGEGGGWGNQLAQRAPPVAGYRWVEPRRMTNICRRNDHDRNDALQTAWFNGAGYESWENLWGCWNGMTPRDAEATRRVARLLRFFGARGFFVARTAVADKHSAAAGDQSDNADSVWGMGWEPHALTLQPNTLFASRFTKGGPHPTDVAAGAPAAACAAGAETLWSIVERAATNASSQTPQPVLQLSVAAFAGCRFYDAYGGTELHPVESPSEDGTMIVSLPPSQRVEARGFGAVLATSNDSATDADLAALLGGMQNLTAGRALASFGGTWLPLLQRRVPPPPPAPLGNEPSVPVLRLSGNASYRFACAGALVTSNAFDNCPDTQYEWEAVPSATHDHTLAVAPFAIDRDPVGCARYARYPRATGYIPADARNFLRGWPNANLSRGEVEFPAGNATTPVTSISHGEAKAFCAWAGGRLPTGVEWQYAAQGGDDTRVYPWGAVDDPTRRPRTSSARTAPAPADSATFAVNGSSTFGVRDLVGNAWEWTADEFQDERTRFALLRGGSRYDIRHSHVWYAPTQEALRLDRYSKYVLMDDALERIYTVGFRCVYDI